MVSFEQCLADTIGSYKIPADICQALNLDNHLPMIRLDWLRRSLYKFNSRLMTVTSDLHRVSFVGRPPSPGNGASQMSSGKILALALSGIVVNNKKWPTVVLALYLAMLVYLCIVTWFQYVQDANWMMLKQLERRLSISGERQRLLDEVHLDVDQMRLQLSDRIVESKRVLELMGAAISDWHFVTQNFNILIMQTIEWFVVRPMRRQFNNWNVLAMRGIVDEENEKRVQVEMVLAEQERFQRDSLLFCQTRLMRLKRDFALIWDEAQQGISPKQKAGKRFKSIIIMNEMLHTEQRQLERNYRMDLRLFKLNALRGRMNPLNRTPAFRDKLALLYIVVYFFYFLYANSIFLYVLYYFSTHFTSHYPEQKQAARAQIGSLRDLWRNTYYVIIYEICALSATFYLSIFSCAISDQMELVKHLRALFMVVIQTNQRRFEELISMGASKQVDGFSELPNGSSEQVRERGEFRRMGQLKQVIQMDLIMLVAKFRLALNTFEQSKFLTQRIAMALFVFALSVPFVWVIHSSYLDENLRLAALGAGASTTLCCLTFLMPVALMYRRHVSLVKSLWTLVGQLSEYEQLPDVNNRIGLSSNVALFIFRRFICDSNLLLERLSVYALSMPVTYINLIRTFSYCIVLMMACGFMTLHLFGDGLALIMTDPFRLFKFLQAD